MTKGFSELDPLSYLTSQEAIDIFLEEVDKEKNNPKAAEYVKDCHLMALEAQRRLEARHRRHRLYLRGRAPIAEYKPIAPRFTPGDFGCLEAV